MAESSEKKRRGPYKRMRYSEQEIECTYYENDDEDNVFEDVELDGSSIDRVSFEIEINIEIL